MNILVLTSDVFKDFVYDVCSPFMGTNFISIYHGEKEFPFEEWNGVGYDIGISFMYTYKVPDNEIESHTWINFHPGPLPEYKGRNLCYHAIMNGEKQFGATVHYMDENFDTGDIIEVLTFSIPVWATSEDLSEFAINASKQLFQLYFPRIVAGEQFTRIPNNGGRYYKKEPIEDTFRVNDYVSRQIRAITYKEFHPKINIHGVTYKIVKDE